MKLKLIIALLIIVNQISAQNVGINTTGATPNSKALLDIDATGMSPKGGLLIPRLTTAERNAITAPIPMSLLIFNTTTECFEAWNQTNTSWVAFGCLGCQLPGAFSASAASIITATTFAANWAASAGATTYYLDVATDAGFTSFVSGYNNLNVGNVLTTNVTGLTCATNYYYRVRANNTCGTSANSNAITVVAGACAKIIFITSVSNASGNFGGLAGGDALCATRATAGGLSGTYKAWLSTTTISASSRLVHYAGPYKLVTGTTIANNWADLTDGSLAAPIDRDEFGASRVFQVYTGTDEFGNSLGYDCSAWTNNISCSPAVEWWGRNYTDCRWTRMGIANNNCVTPGYACCSNLGSLYCIEQ